MSSLSQAAMLVSLSVSCWTGRKLDKRISNQAEEDHNSERGTIRATKLLVPKYEIQPLITASNAIRIYNAEHSLPWLDAEGTRIIPASFFMTWKTNIVNLRDEFDSLARDLESRWPQIVADAPRHLNGAFNAADYPRDIRKYFGARWRISPLPDSDDFRVKMADSERDLIRAQIAESQSDAAALATKDVYKRMVNLVQHMAEKCRTYERTTNAKGKIETTGKLYESMLDNLRDLCEMVPHFNLTGDPNLDALSKKIQRELLAENIESLKEDSDLRNDIADKAQEIANKLSEFMA